MSQTTSRHESVMWWFSLAGEGAQSHADVLGCAARMARSSLTSVSTMRAKGEEDVTKARVARHVDDNVGCRVE